MIYLIRAAGTDLVKVGFTDRVPVARLRALQVGCPHHLVLEHELPGGPLDERRLHAQLEQHRDRGEWFRLPLEFAAAVVAAELRRGALLDAVLLVLRELDVRAFPDRCSCRTPQEECHVCRASAALCHLCNAVAEHNDITTHDRECRLLVQYQTGLALGFNPTELGEIE